MAIIDIQGLHKSYGQHTILSDLDFQVEQGEFVSIVGKSGSGKSTLINIIGLLDQLYSGKYLIHDTELSKCSKKKLAELRNQLFGFVFQMYNLINSYTVKDNILLPVLYGQSKKVDKEYYHSLVRKLKINHLENQYAINLSGGEKQRVGIARAAMNHPSVIIADEPTGNLDVENTKNVLDIFRLLQKEQGVTIIMVTHDPKAALFADKTFRLENGRLVQSV